LANGSPVQICHYNETNYVHPNPGTQSNGRLILNGRDAIVIMPRNPLVAGTVYTASITANGQTTTWTFSATAAPRQEVWPEGMEFELR
jgi:hypothetical protein